MGTSSLLYIYAEVVKYYLQFLSSMVGMLSQDELYEFTGPVNESVQLSRTAVKRIFEENITYSPMEMDYKVKICRNDFRRFTESLMLPKNTSVRCLTNYCTWLQTFLDLLLALEYRATVESMSYFWRILDLDRTGRLSPSNIKFFYAGNVLSYRVECCVLLYSADCCAVPLFLADIVLSFYDHSCSLIYLSHLASPITRHIRELEVDRIRGSFSGQCSGWDLWHTRLQRWKVQLKQPPPHSHFYARSVLSPKTTSHSLPVAIQGPNIPRPCELGSGAHRDLHAPRRQRFLAVWQQVSE